MQVPFTARMVKGGAMALKVVVPGVPKSVRPGASRGRSPTDRMPRVHGKALGVADGGPGGGTPRRQGQSVGRNRAPGPGEVDSEGVEEGLRLRKRRRRYGIPNRPVYRRNVFW